MKIKQLLTIVFFGFTLFASAQQTISGTFSPAKKYTWLIAYHLKSGSQNYVVDSGINDGKFNLKMPADAKPGMYRLVYAVPQEEFFFDVIYDGNEAIELTFNDKTGVSFTKSKENRLLNAYFKQTDSLEHEIIDFYKEQGTNKTLFAKLTKLLERTQMEYEKDAENTIASTFIKANQPYIPAKLETLEDYVANKKKNYFSAIDFKNQSLQASRFLTDKVLNYVHTALPLEQLSHEQTELAMQENVKQVASKLEGVNPNYSTSLYYSLWLQLAGSGYHQTSDFVYKNYLKNLASKTGQTEILTSIEDYNRLRIGVVPPEITWKEGNVTKRLSTLEEAPNYLLIFWSSTCSHCLKELPKLHKALQGNTKVKVIAIGLEDDDFHWKTESAKLDGFTHIISLGKWQSKYAKLYAIDATPSYFLLDKDRKIEAKPETYEKVLELLKK